MNNEPTGSNGILGEIVEAKRRHIALTRRRMSASRTRDLAERADPPLSLADALSSRPGIAVIAEMKRKAPSAGELNLNMDAAERAGEYCAAGAAALSVLTEYDYFLGTLEDLSKAKAVAAGHGVPALQKDFVIDEYQVWAGRAAGADSVLLIVSILEPSQYRDLFELSRSLGMEPLVESFDEEELDVALTTDPKIVGINNRNLKTLETSLEVFERLAPRIGEGRIAVAESGMKNAADVERMGRAGAKAALVGESLMRAGGETLGLLRAMSQSDPE